MTAIIDEIDILVTGALTGLAADPHVTQWRAKETNWVNYFALQHLLPRCRPQGILSEPAQIGIEVSVPQPGGYKKFAVRRDLVIWPRGGMTCWNDQWEPVCHPLAILEWKVHRLHRRNPDVLRERAWLRAYCSWQPSVLGYAIEVDCTETMTAIACSRFLGTDEKNLWLEFQCAGIAQDRMQNLSGH